MGWPTFFRLLYGTAIFALIAQIVAFKMYVATDYPAVSNLVASGFIIKCAIVFGGLVVFAFLFFWIRLLLAWSAIWTWRLLRWLFGWRMIRRYLYGLAALALLAALLYAEENWRGKRDWDHFKHAAEAKGERFDLSSLAPPAVPNDQNFAFSPIVSNSCIFPVEAAEGEKADTNVRHGLDFRLYAGYVWL
jgi:hypothetical protein